MKIGELSEQSGIASHTIRFYESKGLMPKASRGMNGYRVYGEESLECLRRIACAKRLSFSLEDMLSILADDQSSDGKSTEDIDHDKLLVHLDTRLSEVENMMKDLMKQRDEIKQFKSQLLETWEQGRCMRLDDSDSVEN